MDDILPGPSSENEPKSDVDKELTNRFLSGEISFAEYSNEWYSFEDDEEEISQKPDEEVPPAEQKKNIIRRRRCTKLSPALTGLMGEANLRFVRGDRDMAEKMCHEIIKQMPTAPEPYQTLAQIYEADPARALQFSLLAAHLSPGDANEWLRLAAVSRQKNDPRQEMICYTQAIRAEPHNLDTHLKRLELLSVLEESKAPNYAAKVSRVKCYHKIVTCLPASQADVVMKYARLAVTLYRKNNEFECALTVMGTAYKKCSELFNLEDTNIFLELLIACKQYQMCIEVFVANVGVEIEAEIQTFKNTEGEIEEHTNYLNCTFPNNLQVDLKCKLLVCFIYLGAINLVNSLLTDFLTNDVDKAGDLYMDIEEALSSVGQFELALQVLEPLVRNENFDLGAVWLKHAECLRNLGRDDEAISSYHRVLKHAPQHADARRQLFGILERRGAVDDALAILQQDYKLVVSARLLFEQCAQLKKYNRMLKYLEIGEDLLSKSFVRFRHREELSIARQVKSVLDLIYNFRTIRGENPFNENDLQFDEEETFKLSLAQEWDLFKELLEVARQYKSYSTMQRLTFGALVSRNLHSRRADVEFYCLQACLLNGDYYNAFKFVRDLTVKGANPLTWNLLNFVMNIMEESPHGKFLSRLFQKGNNMIKNLFLGNNFLASGRYLVALKYFLEYHEQCKEPMSALLVGITIVMMAAQRTVDKHHNLILQGMSYMMQYHRLRQCPHESYYNLGRVYHMLSINNLAIEYYEKALACAPVAHCDAHGSLDLTQETAFNLYLMYKDHSPKMAQHYLYNYLVI